MDNTHTDTPAPLSPDARRVLVAEDNYSNYMLVKAILEGHDLDRAFTGEEAVEKARGGKYDIILMDIKMPGMNGIEATRAIRAFDTATPIIAVTANAFDSDREEALEAGCTDFLPKPVRMERLLGFIRDCRAMSARG